jgi:flagellar basal-body rod protein FlgC
MGVQVDDIVEVGGPARQEFNPAHPLADENGYIYKPDIDAATEMAEMMQASRSYQNSIEAINTAKQLVLRTLTLGK